MRPGNPVKYPVFGCTFESACCVLINVNMWDVIFVGILLDVEGNGCEGNGFAFPPAYTLESKNWVGIIGEGFVLDKTVLVE